ncbi:MAG: hypothetical protein QOE04_1038 [Mycobacterium sp.]|jgi:hypothetical protein|nr:hypothetical protein [Mycobacterium sp.]MDT5387397.1 hypothetical protein [Mycobacterium sp.]
MILKKMVGATAITGALGFCVIGASAGVANAAPAPQGIPGVVHQVQLDAWNPGGGRGGGGGGGRGGGGWNRGGGGRGGGGWDRGGGGGWDRGGRGWGGPGPGWGGPGWGDWGPPPPPCLVGLCF